MRQCPFRGGGGGAAGVGDPRARRRRVRRRRRRQRQRQRRARRQGLRADARRRREGRRVLHHDELRRPGRGREAGRDAGLPGSRPVRPVAADADRQRGRRQEARRPARSRRPTPRRCTCRSSRSPTPARRSCSSTPRSSSPTSPCRRSRPTTRAAVARRPRHWPRHIGGSGKVFVNNVKPGISTTDARAKGFEEEAKKLGLEFVGMEYRQRPAGQGGVARQGAARQEPGPQGHLRHQPVRRRGLGRRPARGGQAGLGEDRRLRRRPEAGQGP